MTDLKNKIFFLTGSASGIGNHLTTTLLKKGAHVVATDIEIEKLHEESDKNQWDKKRTLLLKLDVRDPGQWEQTIKETNNHFGSVDVLINVAGHIKPGWIYEVSADEVHRHLDTNTKGIIFGTQIVSRHMIQNKKGHIINIASTTALAPIPGIAIYSASKYAVRGFSLATAQELRPYGVYVTVICPDAVKTPMLDLQRKYPEAAISFSGRNILTPENISQVIFKKVLTKKPLEVTIPKNRRWLATIGHLFPSIYLKLFPYLREKGCVRQKEEK